MEWTECLLHATRRSLFAGKTRLAPRALLERGVQLFRGQYPANTPGSQNVKTLVAQGLIPAVVARSRTSAPMSRGAADTSVRATSLK